MYKLYYSPGACSMAVHVVLNEINAPFKLVNANDPETRNRSKEFLKINPRGAVPVLETDGKILREGAAILTYILDNNKNDLLPKSGFERAHVLEWLCFANSTLHPLYSRFFALRGILGDKMGNDPFYKATLDKLHSHFNDLENILSKNQFICGSKLNVADILIAVIANWSANFPDIKIGAKTKEYLKKVSSLPAFKKALEAEGVPYKVA